jgi:hypothetical protein
MVLDYDLLLCSNNMVGMRIPQGGTTISLMPDYSYDQHGALNSLFHTLTITHSQAILNS